MCFLGGPLQEEIANKERMETSDQNQYPSLLSSTSPDKPDKGRRSSEDLFAVHDFNIEIDLDVPAGSEYRSRTRTGATSEFTLPPIYINWQLVLSLLNSICCLYSV